MNFNKSKIVAIITGFISIAICLFYLILVVLLDSRSFVDDYLVNTFKNMEVISCFLRNYCFLFYLLPQ